jgi:Domain of unknown function (DUF4383)
MAEGAYGKLGFARTYALIFGIAYIAVALLELILGDLTAGDFVILQRTTLQNIIHWAVGVVVLGSFFAGEAAARMVARIVGIVFVALTIWGFVSPSSLGDLLGYSGDIPLIYNIIHLVTALVALFAGFAGRSSYRAAAA